MKKLLFLSALIATVYLQSCHDCKNCSENLNGLVTTSYPAAVNDQWVYQVSDSLGNVLDTATFTITAMTVINSDSTIYNTQTKVGNTVTDSGTLVQTPSSFTYRPSGTQSLFEYLKLVYPIQINGSWQGYYTGDTIRVTDANINKNVLAFSYQSVYQLNRNYITPAYAVQATIYLAPNNGIIQQTIQVSTQQTSSYKTIKLVSSLLH